MDPDPLRHLEFFSVPNNQVWAIQAALSLSTPSSVCSAADPVLQTVNSVDQSFSLAGPSSTQPPSIWNAPASFGVGSDVSGPPSATHTALSLDSMPQSSPATDMTAMTGMQPTSLPGHPRPTIPVRTSRAGDSHQRKRSRIASDAVPFDSVDYWIDFDKEDNLADIPEGAELSRSEMKGKGRATSISQRRPSIAHASTVSAPARVSSKPKPKVEDFLDDSALDNALSDEDEGLSGINLTDHLSRIETAPPTDVPPREGLYSTPLSWERPQPGLRMDSLIGLNNAALNDAEQRRLLAIAMNPGPSMGGLGANVNLNFGGFAPGFTPVFGQNMGVDPLGLGLDPVSPPKPFGAQQRPPPPQPPKRQGSVSEKGKEMQEKTEKPKTGDRTAHNDIERKYRTNLKDKIAELRDAVPSLHTIAEEGDDDGSHNRGAKVSKGAVLTKATEYIHYLEKRNKQIMQKHRELSQRLQAFEQLLSATARPQYLMPTYSRTLFDPRGFC
ncbi:helix-loop-helix DNA-binding domain-containing protein [Podospora aff. communis PSN243]|uniref:Helix-loop-helix DNA-binding domain-containing protein n=1 Tax=Podospora aff. communis PSN243 TaxID=3040156 RepID=A0AAV9H1V1_9PEZI|nr:helix-loop-helix DNA-binding domain-containing protein [Podospora aff. communis PSN243]